MNFLSRSPSNNSKKTGAATLLIVLMVMTLSLGVGLAVSRRSSFNIRRSTYTKQTDQAFSCANSGVEVALQCINDEESSDSGDPSGNCAISESSPEKLGDNNECSVWYTVSDIQQNSITIPKLPKDNVQQFDVSGVDEDEMSITWKSLDENINAGLEVTYAYDSGSGDYEMEKFNYVCGTDGNYGGSTNVAGFEEILEDSGTSKCTVDYNTADLPFRLQSSTSPAIIRVRPFFADALVTVNGGSNFASLSQGYKINSTGTAGEVTRKIEVLRMDKQLPPIFDYVLYSQNGSIEKQ